MSDSKIDLRIPPATVRRGQRLAERQRAHLFELELTGRWRLYFKSEEEFKAKIEAASQSIAQWAQLNAENAVEEVEPSADEEIGRASCREREEIEARMGGRRVRSICTR